MSPKNFIYIFSPINFVTLFCTNKNFTNKFLLIKFYHLNCCSSSQKIPLFFFVFFFTKQRFSKQQLLSPNFCFHNINFFLPNSFFLHQKVFLPPIFFLSLFLEFFFATMFLVKKKKKCVKKVFVSKKV